MNQLDFKGRTAAITGGAAGIGLAVARRMVASGARIALWDRDPKALEDAKAQIGGETLSVALDVSDADAVARAVETTAAAFGSIDALICSAGITGPNVPLAIIRSTPGNRCSTSTCTACSCATAPSTAMLKKDYGRIVNIASVAGKEGNPNAVGVQRVEGAVIGLTKSLGRNWQDRHPRQLRDAGRRAHGDLRPDVAAAHRLHAVEVTVGPMAPSTKSRRWCVARSEDCSFSTGACSTSPAVARRTRRIEARTGKGTEDADRTSLLRETSRITFPISLPDSISAWRRWRGERKRFLDHDLQSPLLEERPPLSRSGSRARPSRHRGWPGASSR